MTSSAKGISAPPKMQDSQQVNKGMIAKPHNAKGQEVEKYYAGAIRFCDGMYMVRIFIRQSTRASDLGKRHSERDIKNEYYSTTGQSDIEWKISLATTVGGLQNANTLWQCM